MSNWLEFRATNQALIIKISLLCNSIQFNSPIYKQAAVGKNECRVEALRQKKGTIRRKLWIKLEFKEVEWESQSSAERLPKWTAIWMEEDE